jgi:flagellar basal body-associated protein FliL
MESELKLLQDAIHKAESDLIIFFVVLAVVLIAFIIPLYAMILRDRKEHRASESTRQDKYLEREREIIRVITANTEVNAGLKATLEMMNADTKSSFVRIHERIDNVIRLINRRITP